MRDHHRLIGLMSKYLGFILGTLLTIMSMLGLHKLIMRPITPTHEGEQALQSKQDVFIFIMKWKMLFHCHFKRWSWLSPA